MRWWWLRSIRSAQWSKKENLLPQYQLFISANHQSLISPVFVFVSVIVFVFVVVSVFVFVFVFVYLYLQYQLFISANHQCSIGTEVKGKGQNVYIYIYAYDNVLCLHDSSWFHFCKPPRTIGTKVNVTFFDHE